MAPIPASIEAEPALAVDQGLAAWSDRRESWCSGAAPPRGPRGAPGYRSQALARVRCHQPKPRRPRRPVPSITTEEGSGTGPSCPMPENGISLWSAVGGRKIPLMENEDMTVVFRSEQGPELRSSSRPKAIWKWPGVGEQWRREGCEGSGNEVGGVGCGGRSAGCSARRCSSHHSQTLMRHQIRNHVIKRPSALQVAQHHELAGQRIDADGHGTYLLELQGRRRTMDHIGSKGKLNCKNWSVATVWVVTSQSLPPAGSHSNSATLGLPLCSDTVMGPVLTGPTPGRAI